MTTIGNQNAVSGIGISELQSQAASIGRTIATLELERLALLLRVALMRAEIEAAASKPTRAHVGTSR